LSTKTDIILKLIYSAIVFFRAVCHKLFASPGLTPSHHAAKPRFLRILSPK